MGWFRLSAAIVACLAAALPSDAAEIHRFTGREGTVITVEGALASSDGQKFAEAASGVERAMVVFSSDGGNLLAGLRIGQFVRLHEMRTLVPDGKRCASACALAWLGGVERLMQPSALIGFHAAYTREAGGETRESGAGNALVGAYLNRLGLSDDAILYIERAHPEQITWLSERNAKRVGIDVTMVQPPDRANPGLQTAATDVPAPPDPPKAAVTLTPARDRAAVFAGDYFTHWSESNPDALGYFTSVYAGQVDFYGTPLGRSVVLEQKRKFAERWPERIYAVRPSTVQAECGPASCNVTGVVDWDARNVERRARTSGSASFRLQVAQSGSRTLIMSESGQVISRGPSGLPADDPAPKLSSKETEPDEPIQK
jgi:hypothetical protein